MKLFNLIAPRKIRELNRCAEKSLKSLSSLADELASQVDKMKGTKEDKNGYTDDKHINGHKRIQDIRVLAHSRR